MSDYNMTRTAAGKIVSRFANMLEDLEDDYEEEIVVVSLVKYYDLCDDDEDLLWAIRRVLADYMTPQQLDEWNKRKGLDALAKADVEDDLV